MTLKLAGEMPSAARAGARIGCLLHSFKEGQYIHSLPFMALATGTLGAGRLYAVPMVVGRRMALDRIAVEVTAAAADKLLRLGIYSNSRSLYPADLLLDAGTVPLAATGVKSLDIAVVLEAGLCWLVCVSDGAPQLRLATYAFSPLGLAAGGFGLLNIQTHYRQDGAGAGALPAAFPPGAELHGDYAPVILCRLQKLG